MFPPLPLILKTQYHLYWNLCRTLFSHHWYTKSQSVSWLTCCAKNQIKYERNFNKIISLWRGTTIQRKGTSLSIDSNNTTITIATFWGLLTFLSLTLHGVVVVFPCHHHPFTSRGLPTRRRHIWIQGNYLTPKSLSISAENWRRGVDSEMHGFFVKQAPGASFPPALRKRDAF